ncbi:MAG: hypothetical protein GKR94_27190 [Gammaproteobacteria bacterium]|nr:hypothetical protein [Gammaproteobacteria bacterium]
MPRDYKFRSQHIQAERSQSAKPRYPGWMWGLAGFGLGLCVSVAAYVEGRYPGTIFEPSPPGIPITDSSAVAISDEKDAAKTSAHKPKFIFEAYSLLRDMEVEVKAEPKPKRATLKTNEDVRSLSGIRQIEPAQPVKPGPAAEYKQNTKAAATSDDQAANKAVIPPRSLLAKHAPTRTTSIEELIARNKTTDQYMLQVGSFNELASANALRASLVLNGYDALIQTVSANGDHVHRVRLGPYDKAGAERTKANLALRQVQAQIFRI